MKGVNWMELSTREKELLVIFGSESSAIIVKKVKYGINNVKAELKLKKVNFNSIFLILETIITWGHMILFFEKLGKIAVVFKTTVLGNFLYVFFSINKHMSSSL